MIVVFILNSRVYELLDLTWRDRVKRARSLLNLQRPIRPDEGRKMELRVTDCLKFRRGVAGHVLVGRRLHPQSLLRTEPVVPGPPNPRLGSHLWRLGC